jgi:hypothetical protein
MEFSGYETGHAEYTDSARTAEGWRQHAEYAETATEGCRAKVDHNNLCNTMFLVGSGIY